MREAIKALLTAMRDWQSGPDYDREARLKVVTDCWRAFQDAAIEEGLKQFYSENQKKGTT